MNQDTNILLTRDFHQISDLDFPTPHDVLIKGGAHKADALPGIVAEKIRSSEGLAKINLDKAMELIADPAKDLAPQALDESNDATHEVTESLVLQGFAVHGVGFGGRTGLPSMVHISARRKKSA